MAENATARSLDDYVPLSLFHKDHWTTLAYAETVMVDVGGFQIGADARMRSGRRNYRVMRQMCPTPRRAQQSGHLMMVMDIKNSTTLRDGSVIQGHDDWHCIQDMAAAGFFRVADTIACVDHLDPGVILHLSPLGRTVCELLRAHKAGGGTFANFEFGATRDAGAAA